MSDALSTAASSDALMQQLDERFRDHPVRRFLDFRLLELGDDRCVMSIELNPEFDNSTGAVHGGILAMLADTAVACALATSFEGKMEFVTSNLNIHFLRRANTAVVATASVIKKGSKVCVGLCELHDSERRLVALCTADFVLLPER
jgi:uncharacterized protein (TIGR00369 family)